MESDHYITLGVPYDASADEIRNAYHLLARTLHPDVNPDPAVQETFLAIQQAYEILSNPRRKEKYDRSLPADIRSRPDILVSVRYSRSVLPTLDEPQLVYALVDLVCTADLKTKHLPPCHLCLVLDRSTSMRGLRMDMVKSSALNLLQQLRPQDFLSVVSFSDRAEVLVPPTRASALTKSDHRISLLQPSGGTEILQGLTLGMEQLRQTQGNYLRHLVLLTDGQTYGDDEGCLDLARQAAVEQISISALGIGHEWNDTLLDQIGSLSGGSSVFISDARELDRFLIQKLTELETLYASGLRFEFESSPNALMRYAFRLSPNLGPLSTGSPILLGDIQYRKSISVLFEFILPPIVTEIERLDLARGLVWMEIPERNSTRARIPLELTRQVKVEAEAETPPSVILEAMSKLTLYRMQEKIRYEVGEGKIEKATKHLHYLATNLLSQGDRELAHTVLIEAEHVQQSRRFSGEGEKRIKYGTRSLLLPPGPELRS